MKKILAFLLMVSALSVAQAITVNWFVPNSQYIGGTPVGGGEQIADWASGQTYYLVHSQTEYTNYTDFYNDNKSSYLTALNSKSTWPGDTAVVSFGGNDTTFEAGYYYLFVVNSNNTDEYIVSNAYYYSGTGAFAGQQGASTGDGQSGGATEPDVNEFYMPSWMGGTWSAPRATPEPTALALLALGIAGFALRRKAV